MASRTPYEILGVAPDADDEIVRAAYRVRAKQRHPDTAGDDETRRGHLEDEMKAVNAAFDVLKNPSSRADLDARLRREREAADAARRQDDAADWARRTTSSTPRPSAPGTGPSRSSTGPSVDPRSPFRPTYDPPPPRTGPADPFGAYPFGAPVFDSASGSAFGGFERPRTSAYREAPPIRRSRWPARNGGSFTAYGIRLFLRGLVQALAGIPDSEAAKGMLALIGTVLFWLGVAALFDPADGRDLVMLIAAPIAIVLRLAALILAALVALDVIRFLRGPGRPALERLARGVAMGVSLLRARVTHSRARP